MRTIGLCILFGLAACAGAEANQPADMAMVGWKTAYGKAPTKADFAAVLAACQDKAVAKAQEKPLESCLGDLGLKRAE